MTQSPSKLNSDGLPLFLDASVIINLVASNRINDVLSALSRPVLIEEAVRGEFTRHPRDGCDPSPVIAALTERGQLTVVKMTQTQFETFLGLTGCPAPDDLGDGEAATLACANGVGSAVIDENKAIRIAAKEFPNISVYSSLDILCAEPVARRLGSEELSTAVYEAIKVARMRVPHQWRKWVHELLGESRSAELSALK